MTDAELKIFIDIVTDYFETVTGEKAEMGVPYIKKENPVILGYTGIIGISGSSKGGLFVTASGRMLQMLASAILGTEEVDEQGIIDMAGELSNTIAGNARESFGSRFMISVPIVIKGAAEDIFVQVAPPVYVIPVTWKSHSCYLAIGLE